MHYSDRATMLKKCASGMVSTLFTLPMLLMLLSLLACNKLIAAELGEATVRSYHGQPLVLDIELMALAPDEVTGLQAKLASQDVYRSANVRIHPALASLRIATRQDGARQFLHVTTSQAIDVDYLHLFLELTAGGRHSVRTITVWLPVDLAPAPTPRPAFQQTRQQMPVSLVPSDPPSSALLADHSGVAMISDDDVQVGRSLLHPMPAKVMAKNEAESVVANRLANRVIDEAAGVPRNRVGDVAKNGIKNNAKNSFKNSANNGGNKDVNKGANNGVKSAAENSGKAIAEREASNAAKEAAADDAARVSEQTIAALGLENTDLKSRIAALEQKNVALQQVDASKQAAVALALAVAEKPIPSSSSFSLAITGALLLGLIAFGLLGFFGFRYRKTLAASRTGTIWRKLLRIKAIAPVTPAASIPPVPPVGVE
jgi:Tfp pilus assembly protein FimV